MQETRPVPCQNSSSSSYLGFHVIVRRPFDTVDQARNGSAALDHSRDVYRLVGIVQRRSLAAGLVSPMGPSPLEGTPATQTRLRSTQHLGELEPYWHLTTRFAVDQQVVEALAPQC